MEVVGQKEVKTVAGVGCPEPIRMVIPVSTWVYLKHFYKHHFASQPISQGSQVVLLLLFVGWGLAYHYWWPLAIFLGLTLALKALLGILVCKSHRALRSGRVSYRIDRNGISMVLMEQGRYIRYDTDPWEAVKRVYLYDDFCAITMCKEVKLSSEFYLFAKDMAVARQAVLGFWQRAANGTAAEHLDVYSPREREAAIGGIERTFGSIAMVRSPRKSHDFKVEFALVSPTPENPFCKICTLGVGALLAKNVEDEVRWSGNAAESVELMMYLPASWNLLGEGWDKEENWWPYRLLLTLVDEMIHDESRFMVGEWFPIDPEDGMPARVSAVLFGYPFWQNPRSSFNLSTGRVVDFVQIIPIVEEEFGAVEESYTYQITMGTLLDIDVYRLDEMEPEEANHIYTKAIIEHFEKRFGRKVPDIPMESHGNVKERA